MPLCRQNDSVNASQKIERVREGLKETFLLRGEMNNGYDRAAGEYKFYSRCLEDDFSERVDVPESQIQGILDILKDDGFISGYSHEPIYSDGKGTFLSTQEAGSIICVHFPVSFQEKTEPFAVVTFDPDTREVLCNETKISRPNFGSVNYLFIEYVARNPNTTIDKKTLSKEVEGYTGPNQILSDLNFKGILRELFFPGASVEGVHFKNPITIEDLKKHKISETQFHDAVGSARN